MYVFVYFTKRDTETRWIIQLGRDACMVYVSLLFYFFYFFIFIIGNTTDHTKMQTIKRRLLANIIRMYLL